MEFPYWSATRYRVDMASAAVLFELLRKGAFSPKALKRCKKTGEVSFVLLRREARRFEAFASEAGLAFLCVEERGILRRLSRIPARPGMIVGTLLGVALLVLSGLFVWDIEITCDAEMAHEEILAQLAEVGLYRGAFLPRIDDEEIETALRRANGRVAFVALNITGTVARVQIRASEAEPERETVLPANLVASRDGVITMPLVFEGECLVAPGDVVRAGQILASGLIDTQNHGYRVTRAAGEILARTSTTYTVRVPLFDTRRVLTGREKCEITLLFFDRARKVFKNTGKMDIECDIIENTKWLSLPSGKRLPIGITTRTYVPVTYVEVQRTTQTALETAREQMETLLAKECVGRTLLSRSERVIEEPDALTLVLTLVCEEDIASVAEFSFAP